MMNQNPLKWVVKWVVFFVLLCTPLSMQIKFAPIGDF